MKDANEFCVEVTKPDQAPQDYSGIRMNVDNFDEAYKLLTDRGFTNVQGEKVTDTGTSKVALMVSPSGFTISLAEHIRKESQQKVLCYVQHTEYKLKGI